MSWLIKNKAGNLHVSDKCVWSKLNPLTGFSNFLNLDTMQVSLPAPKAILMLVVPRFGKHERNL